jgi:hypothetical protein
MVELSEQDGISLEYTVCGFEDEEHDARNPTAKFPQEAVMTNTLT